jgi:hypothetical protein
MSFSAERVTDVSRTDRQMDRREDYDTLEEIHKWLMWLLSDLTINYFLVLKPDTQRWGWMEPGSGYP